MAMWFGGVYLAVGVTIFVWDVMRDTDRRHLEWSGGLAGAGLGLLILYGLLDKPKQDTPPTFHEPP